MRGIAGGSKRQFLQLYSNVKRSTSYHGDNLIQLFAGDGACGEETEAMRTTRQRGDQRPHRVTNEMVLRQVAVCYLRNAAQMTLSQIARSHVTMAEPCDINSITQGLSYAVANVEQILDMIPNPTQEQIDSAWERFRSNTQRTEELEVKVISHEL